VTMIQRRNMLMGAAAIPLAATTPATDALTEPQRILDRLVGTTWKAVTIAGDPVKPISGPASSGQPVTRTVTSTLGFPNSVRVAGHSGCNSYSGALSIVGDQIRITSLITTLILCWPPAVMDQEQRFLAALKAARRVSLDGAFLVLHPRRHGPTTRLVRVKEPSRG
jgi:heat shock protein HslJ